MQYPHVTYENWPPVGTVLRRKLLAKNTDEDMQWAKIGLIVFVKEINPLRPWRAQLMQFPTGEVLKSQVSYAPNAWEILETDDG